MNAVPRYALHGLVLETRTELPEDPGALLLDRLPAAPPGAAADVLVTSRPASLPGALAGLDAEAWAGDDQLRVRSGATGVDLRAPGGAAAVTPDGRIELAVDLAAVPGGLPAVAFGILNVAVLAALRLRGLFHLHAACVVAPDGRSVLVPGASGAGKTTLASALVAAGFGYLGDDVVLVARTPAGPELLAMPRAFHLTALTARAIPGAAARAGRRRSVAGKHVVDPRLLFPGRERLRAPAPSASLFPAVASRPDTAVAPLAPVDALGRLLECSALVAARGLPGAAAHLATLAAIADGGRAFAVELGEDLLADPAAAAARIAAAVLR